jgi:hypothetical protein
MLNRTLETISTELAHARHKFPMPNPTFVALAEEVGELAQALLKCKPVDCQKATAVYDEAKQVAVMAIRIMEEGDSHFPAYDPLFVEVPF